jgi:GxGYxYP putative glycoside hydrolase C-terminal domain/GxGYxY sequence motif in domain of unknown function N-terminal/Secretion system C-terminal sorting domain
MKKICFFFLLVIAAFPAFIVQPVSAQTAPARIANSPYPVSAQPDTLFLVSFGNYTPDQQFTTVTLQGLLAVKKPRIMLQLQNPNTITDLAQNYGVTYDSSYLNDFSGLMGHFADSINGYLLCLMNDSSANIAVTSCRFMNAIAATPNDTAALNALGIPMVYNMTGKSRQWVFDTFQPLLNKRIISYQDTVKNAFLSDYSIFAGALQYWDTTFTALSDSFYNNMITGTSVMMGWGPDEHSSVLQCSQHGVMVHASDWSSNLSTYTNFNVPAIKQTYTSPDTVIIPNTHTVCFVMTDGDNIQWLQGGFGTDPSWYGSTKRGQAPIGWTMSPAMGELAPTMMQYYYNTEANTPQGGDYFIAAASGLGYFYPDAFNDLDSAAALTARMMQKSDLHILNIIGNVFSDTFFTPYLSQPNIDAIFYYDYNNYGDLFGKTACVNGKPVITPRGNLWSWPYNCGRVASVLNQQTKDPTSPNGYSLVDVNVWTHNVDSILYTISMLDSSVRVVSPDAFVKLFEAGVTCESANAIKPVAADVVAMQCFPNPASGNIKVTFELPQTLNADLSIINLCGQNVATITTGNISAGRHQYDVNITGLANGIYFISLKGPEVTATQKLVIAN